MAVWHNLTRKFDGICHNLTINCCLLPFLRYLQQHHGGHMLIEFSLKNYKSIAETQTLSLVASKIKELHENVIQLDEPNKLELLRSAAIYGANAAGKSNFMDGLDTMAGLVVHSASNLKSGELLPVDSFMLDNAFRNEPSEFEISFISEGVRYQYGFTASKERIHEEWLYAFPKGRQQRWFVRIWDPESNDYDWDMGPSLTGEKLTWQKSTRQNALFLTTAVQLNSVQLQPVYAWFNRRLRMTNVAGWNDIYSAKLCLADKKHDILKFLKAADIDIDDIQVTKEKFNPNSIPDGMPDSLKEMMIKNLKDEERYDIKTLHKNTDGDLISFDFESESDGTRKLFSFAGPWIDSLNKGNVLVIDELHDNLHPKLVGFLVGLFNNHETNPNNAQLVFSTHETSILNQNVFRRDQIWFCSKDINKATQLYPLTDFSPRKGRDNLESSYLEGRYGALPFIGKVGF
jgi:AAA15 family ATPase/GTPase